MIQEVRARAAQKTAELIKGLTREVLESERDFMEASFAYQEVFHELFPTEMVQMSWEDMAAAMWHCIEEGEPFDPGIPEGALA